MKFNTVNPRACPGSYTRARVVLSNGRGLCDFCFTEQQVRNNGMIRGHRR